MIEKIRVSMGTLKVLGMELLKTDSDPRTAYLQTYHPGKCNADCLFCAQAKNASSREKNIARGLYPERETKEVLIRLEKAYEHGLLKRACIQTMNYPSLMQDLMGLIKRIKDIPISVSVFPLCKENYGKLKELGVDKLVIPLDACSKEIFAEIKGENTASPYTWEKHLLGLENAVDVFGKRNVGTHLILGLGETEKEAVEIIKRLHDMGVYSALFAYTPIKGTRLYEKKARQPDIGHYRRIQVAQYLIEKQKDAGFEYDRQGRIIDFNLDEEEMEEIISEGKAFMTKGCPNCNRPFSTESPGKSLYNYPYLPDEKEREKIKRELWKH